MKQYLKSVTRMSLAIILIAFTSCDNEPLDKGLIENAGQQEICQEAADATIGAIQNLTNATDANYETLCNALKTALRNQITVCGDPTGETQDTIDSLDCESVDAQCQNAQTASSNAEAAYNINTTDTTLCNAYKTALQNEIAACGDTNGSLQDIIDGLGDCTFGTSGSGDLSVTAGTLNINFTTNTVDLESGIIIVNGSNEENGANYFIYFEVMEDATGVDIMQNFMLTLNGGEYFPNTDGFDDFTNTITVNSGGVIQGTFGGIVTRTDGADLSLSQGLIDLSY
tara:strand:- start:19372 stop:20223 length:852 start_codon:yes stop_codon:yes gene_type:complete